ncbi:NAD-dependent epimerase/dehydratase family protein [Marinomonas algicola]|uniref:NAD-dependent epimerase/dehydratase family protein n=1 Tax=Marinomonas algicola TaxID=2773454 RepID=UPI00174B00B2|nr:NAD-dependent epimerase/dehydratase family protein [Marinomonas algicola]
MVNNKGKVVLVTGATGFLAKHLIPLLRIKGYYVVGVAKRNECDVFMDEYYRLDLMDRALTSERVKQVSPDFVIHLAGISFVNHPTWEDLSAANVDATENLLCALQAHQPDKIQAVLLASSGIVYGENAIGCINESVSQSLKMSMENQSLQWNP